MLLIVISFRCYPWESSLPFPLPGTRQCPHVHQTIEHAQLGRWPGEYRNGRFHDFQFRVNDDRDRLGLRLNLCCTLDVSMPARTFFICPSSPIRRSATRTAQSCLNAREGILRFSIWQSQASTFVPPFLL